MVVTKAEAMGIVKKIKGEFFSVVFTKRTDGKVRTMNCRKGVKCHLRGGDLSYDPNEKGLVIVWDRRVKDYRSFPYEGLLEVHTDGGQVYKVV